MEREKRQVKLPEAYIIPKVCYPRIRKKKPKKRPAIEASYQIIPTPLKFVYSTDVFPISGDIALRRKNGTLETEMGMLNMCLNCRGVDIVKDQTCTVINMLIERKFQLQLPAWQWMVETLLQEDNSELRAWAERIKRHSLQDEECKRSLKNAVALINGINESDLAKITEQTKKKVRKLFAQYPCINFVATQGKDCSKLTDICCNEQYLQEFGYNMESFTTAILQEGIPQIIPKNMACSAKILVECFYNLGWDGCETPEIISEVLMRNGYIKTVRYKQYFFPSYEGDTYQINAIIAFVGKVNTAITKDTQKLEINKSFLKKVIRKEKDSIKFMQSFYNKTMSLPYTSKNKICKIKELEPEKEDLEFDFEPANVSPIFK